MHKLGRTWDGFSSAPKPAEKLLEGPFSHLPTGRSPVLNEPTAVFHTSRGRDGAQECLPTCRTLARHPPYTPHPGGVCFHSDAPFQFSSSMTFEEENKYLEKYHLSVLKEIKWNNESNQDTVQNLPGSFALRKGRLPLWKGLSVPRKQLFKLLFHNTNEFR